MTGTRQDPRTDILRYDHAVTVTPNDGADLAVPQGEALHVSVAGTLRVDMAGGELAVNFPAVPVGIFPIRVTKVHATGTSATGILKLW